MKTKVCLLLATAALLLTGCGEKGAKVDIYKNSRSVSVDELKFDFLVPTTETDGSYVTMLVTFSVENTGSKSFEMSFSKKPYFYRESDERIYEITTGTFSNVPASYVIESGQSQSFSFKTRFNQEGPIIVPYPSEGFGFMFEYNEIFSINYHFTNKTE